MRSKTRAIPLPEYDSPNADTATPPHFGGDVLALAYSEAIKESRTKSVMCWVLIGLLGLSITLNLSQFQYIPPASVVSETADGRIRPLPTMDEPIFSDQHVMNWAAEKFESLYDLPFTEISTYPGRIRTFMLPKSAKEFVKGLREAGIIDKVSKERLVLRGIRTAPPTIVDSFIDNGRFIWVIEMPLSAVFEGAGGKTNRLVQNVILRGFIGREHLMRAEDGLVVGAIEVYPGRG